MQSVLSPIVGRLSDVLDRKWMATIPPLIAFVGAVISAKASSIDTLIGGGILIGVTLSTISIVQAIPSEVLPLKYRALANGFAFLAGAFGGLAGGLGAGGVTNVNASGWRDIFWIQAGLHLATALGLFIFYNPPRRSDYPKMSLWGYIWSCDPIGSFLFISSATILLISLDWAAGSYPWHDLHVAVPLGLGCGLLVAFGLYEWKGRNDGLLAHVFFQQSPNFALSVFAFAVEGWIFYSAVNSITPQIVLNLGYETNAWKISVRQLSYTFPTIVASIPITLYSTRYKDLKSPLIFTFALFLVVCICYATITPNEKNAQIGFNVLCKCQTSYAVLDRRANDRQLVSVNRDHSHFWWHLPNSLPLTHTSPRRPVSHSLLEQSVVPLALLLSTLSSTASSAPLWPRTSEPLPLVLDYLHPRCLICSRPWPPVIQRRLPLSRGSIHPFLLLPQTPAIGHMRMPID